MDRGAGQATVHRVPKSQTQLSNVATCTMCFMGKQGACMDDLLL